MHRSMHQRARFLSGITIAPCSFETAAIAAVAALFGKQFGPERSVPLPCRRRFAPEYHLSSDSFRALENAGHPSALGEPLAVLSIIACPQPENMLVP
jgi:hypothetical protein